MNNNTFSFGILRFLSLPAIMIITIVILLPFLYFHLISEITALWILIPVLIIEIILWLLFFSREIIKLHKSRDKTKRNISIGIIVLYLICCNYGYNYATRGDYLYTENSPCGNYKLEVYLKPQFFAMPGGGGLYSKSTTLLLKNKRGWTIGRSDDEVFYGNLEIEWDYTNKCVWFARGNTLDF